jgi:hypothetical protein
MFAIPFCFELCTALLLLEMSVYLLLFRWEKLCFVTDLDINIFRRNASSLIINESIKIEFMLWNFCTLKRARPFLKARLSCVYFSSNVSKDQWNMFSFARNISSTLGIMHMIRHFVNGCLSFPRSLIEVRLKVDTEL